MTADLFGDRPEKPKKAKKEKPPKATNPDIAKCINHYATRFKERFGFKPKINGGKDGKHFKEILSTWKDEGGCALVISLLDEFFATRDPRVLRSDYSVGAFYSLAQYLRLAANRTDDRTMANLDAASRATKPRK